LNDHPTKNTPDKTHRWQFSPSDAVALKLFENKTNQTELAMSMRLTKSKVAEVLAGKRKPDLKCLKGIHKILKIDAEFLLEHA
jgi:HTH-type transcriptional regulator/antitoxin HigA